MKNLLAIFGTALLICGCASTPEKQSYEQNVAFFRTKSEQVVKQACTNDVAGLTQVVEIDMDDAPRDISKWRASATVEFTDTTGTVQRKQLTYGFVFTGNDLFCSQKY